MRALLALLVACVAGCTTEVNVEARTQILLRVNTQSQALRETFSAVRVEITRREGDEWQPGSSATFDREVIKWPIDLPVTPGAKEDRAKQFQAVIEVLDGKVVLAQARLVTSFVPGIRKVADLWVEPCAGHEPGFVCDDADCRGSDCKVCSRAGECVEVGVLDASELPEQTSDVASASAFDAGSRDSANRKDASAASIKDATTARERDASQVGDDAGEAPPSVDEKCETDGALRCGKPGTPARQRCEAGKWMESEACESGSICDQQADKPGACRELLAVCSGSAGKSVCDGEVMRLCDAQGNSERMEACSSANHCQRGLDAGKCAICLAGEYRCSGAQLEVCADDGLSFKPSMSCDSAALCNAAAGTCGQGCMAGSKVCAGDQLRKCKADLTGFEDEMSCQAGLCDAPGKQCDICVPMAKKCEGNSVSTCNAQGQATTMQACTAPKSLCTGNGVCVECTASAPCAAPAKPCMAATCDLTSGSCGTAPKRVGTSCATGVCDGQGECVQCVEDVDCAKVSGKGKCSRNTCVACAAESDCGAGKSCVASACVDKVVCGDGIINGDEKCDTGKLGTSPYECVNEGGRCVKKTLYTSCATTADCSADEFCIADSFKTLHYCSKMCSNFGRTGVESGCPAPPNGLTAMCGGGFGFCMAAKCTSDSQCATGMTCYTEVETPYCIGCRDDGDCPLFGTCIKPTSMQDTQDGYCR